MRKLILILTIIFPTIIFPTIIFSQIRYSNRDLRLASGDGPYPFYLNAKIGHAWAPLYSGFRESCSELYGTKSKIICESFTIAGGVSARLPKPILGNNVWGLELGYTKLFSNNVHNDTIGFRFSQSLMSLRIAYRWNLLFPVTVQFQGGAVLYNKDKIQKLFTSELLGYKLRPGHQVKRSHGLCSGIELGTRFLFSDPAGTDGGIGFMLDLSYNYFFDKQESLPFIYQNLGVEEFDSNSYNYFSIGLGIVLPLAVLWKI